MATVIDALVVTLGLDPKGFKTGSAQARADLKKTADESAVASKEMEARGKQAAQFFSKIRNEALALLGVFAAGMGIKNFVEHTITGAASLGRLSQNLGMSTESLSAWQRVAEDAGSTAESMTAQLAESQQTLAQLKMGGGANESLQWFWRMGGSTDDLKDGNTYLLARAKIIADLNKTDPARAQFVASKMGISPDQFNLLKQGPAAVLAQVEAVQKLSAISAEDARKADDLRKKWLGLERTFESTGIRVVESLMPAFDMLIGYLKQLADWIASHQHDITEWINEAIGTVKEFSKDANKAAEAVGGWKNVLIVLAAIKILSTVSPLFQLASALASVGSALGVIGTLGPAAIAALAGLYVAKKMGLPDVDEKQGKLDLENDDWLAASGHLSAGDFIAAGWDEVKKAVSAVKNNSYRGSHQDEKYLSGLEEKYRLPAGLLDSVWQTESGRGKNMLSSSGAKGHFQFMDATAKQYGLKDPNDFKESVEAAARYYRDLLKQNKGDLPKALAAYNWGQGNVNRYGLEKAPAETRGYIGKVMAGMAQDAGIPNAAQANALSIAGMAPKASMPSNPPPGSSSTSSSEVNINGPITVTTQATDAQGVARGLGSAINQYHFVTQANNGLS